MQARLGCCGGILALAVVKIGLGLGGRPRPD